MVDSSQLPIELLKERDPLLQFPTDLSTEAGQQALEIWTLYSSRPFEEFCATARTRKFPSNPPTVIVDIDITDKHYFTTKKNGKYVRVVNKWAVVLDNYAKLGKWASFIYVDSKIKEQRKYTPKKGKVEDMKSKSGIPFKNKK